MNKIILPFLGATIAGASCAQTVTNDAPPVNDTLTSIIDTTAYQPDSSQGIAFTRAQIDGIERASAEAARDREERAAARAGSPAGAGAGASSTSKSTSKSVKRTGSGKQLSLAQATDPEGRKHWKRMSKRSMRRNPDSPPGTTPVH